MNCFSEQNMRYVGRFAPSPTGPLHLGSLVAAMAASLDARAHGGILRLRIDDVDTTRVVADSADRIVQSLTAHGVRWDGAVRTTTDRNDCHAHAFARLVERGLVYGCHCSRAQILAIQATQGRPHTRGSELYYPGTCRAARIIPSSAGQSNLAWRLQVEEGSEQFEDRAAGRITQDVAQEVGDFILRRADGAWAYHLAIVVDDAADGVTDIVRGDDLLGTTARQRQLQRVLGLQLPRTMHVPVVRTPSGEKLSKQTQAPALDDQNPMASLIAAALHLELGGYVEASGLGEGQLVTAQRIETFWTWATAAWARRWGIG
jgi:glutamyl-Q tRNA(Asp) synthetase